ncbi:MAG: septum formation protein Maf [Oscillospiraceae bacterium]|nr:septum formation protein Maf [Oscillospiraceae bacterium]
MAFYLASASPRRKDLLKKAGIEDFSVRPADVDESLDASLSAAEAVMTLARRKAEAAQQGLGEEDYVLAADTLVYLDETALGKPRDENDAFRMLKALSGRAHEVYTGICLRRGSVSDCEYECTRVFFSPLTDKEIWDYIRTGEPMDKAGAYGVQGAAGVFIPRIEGDYYNVMGLPVSRLYKMLTRHGLELKL